MALTQFIKDLLYTNEKLTIPGFGSFVAQHTSAQVNSEKKLLFPPQRHFIFNAALNQEDDIFATYVGLKTNVNLLEAKKAVKLMVEDFHRKLKDGNTLYIEKVGYFILDENKEIKFKADDENNFHPESFGLDPIHYRPPVQQVEESITEEYYPERKRTSLKKILVVFLILNIIGALSAIVYWKFNDIKQYVSSFTSSKQDLKSVAVEDTQKLIADPDTSELGQYIDTTTNIKNALKYEESVAIDTVSKPEKPVVDNKVVSSSKVKYYIIAGSFQTFEKADVHAKLLKNKGFKPEIIEFSQNLFRISIEEFSDKEEAVRRLEIIKSKKGTETAWLLAK